MNLQNILLLLFTFTLTWNCKLTNGDAGNANSSNSGANAGVHPEARPAANNAVVSTKENDSGKHDSPMPVINLNLATATKTHSLNKTAANDKNASTSSKLPHGPLDEDVMQSGALLRGFFVLLGVTVLLLLYLGLRMYRLRKGGQKPNIMVRKYGVLANRSDVEMLPLPLDEDEDDDTVFDVSSRNENH